MTAFLSSRNIGRCLKILNVWVDEGIVDVLLGLACLMQSLSCHKPMQLSDRVKFLSASLTRQCAMTPRCKWLSRSHIILSVHDMSHIMSAAASFGRGLRTQNIRTHNPEQAPCLDGMQQLRRLCPFNAFSVCMRSTFRLSDLQARTHVKILTDSLVLKAGSNGGDRVTGTPGVPRTFSRCRAGLFQVIIY